MNNNKILPPPQVPVVLAKSKSIYTIWINHIPNIPRTSRYTYGNRVDTSFLEFLENLYTVSYLPVDKKMVELQNVISKLDTLRFLFQLGYESKLIPQNVYINISTPLVEIGKMLGGWKRGMESKIKTPQ